MEAPRRSQRCTVSEEGIHYSRGSQSVTRLLATAWSIARKPGNPSCGSNNSSHFFEPPTAHDLIPAENPLFSQPLTLGSKPLRHNERKSSGSRGYACISDTRDCAGLYLQPHTTAVSAFLHTPEIIPYSSTPSIIHLKRDLLVPLSFQPPEASSLAAGESEHRDGRAAAFNSKGILNTRFGDFPHSSIVGIPYGSQVCAAPSAHNRSGRKRKRKEDSSTASAPSAAEPDRSTGFLHVLAPTAELWTASLPHRAQVVYTPDSSYILHKLRARAEGEARSALAEAGAGSGNFTHAAVGAVYRGYPDGRGGGEVTGKRGVVFSFEFHKDREADG